MDLDTDIDRETDTDQANGIDPRMDMSAPNSRPPTATGIPFSRPTTALSIGGVSVNKDHWLTDTPREFSSSVSKLPMEDSRDSTPRPITPAMKGRKASVAPYETLLQPPQGNTKERKVSCKPIFIILGVVGVIILLAIALSVGVLLGMGGTETDETQ